MKILLAMACRSTPDAEHLKRMVVASGASYLVLSVAVDADVPPLPAVDGTLLRHDNVPWGLSGHDFMRHVINNIDAPIAQAVESYLGNLDVVFHVHDDIKPNSQTFAKLASLIPDNVFASVQPVYGTMPITGEPFLYSHSTRFVAWRPEAFVKYIGQTVSEDEDPPEETMRGVMAKLDAAKEPYVWTQLPVTHI